MTHTFGRMRDLSQEYEDMAAFFARVYGNGCTTPDGRFFGTATVNVAPEIVDFILLDPIAWENRVKDYAYGMAMEGKQ